MYAVGAQPRTTSTSLVSHTPPDPPSSHGAQRGENRQRRLTKTSKCGPISPVVVARLRYTSLGVTGPGAHRPSMSSW
jgi:hypothetical protein